jgi:sporulation protein YqfC
MKKALTELLKLPKEIILDFPLLTIVGNEEVLIENYRGLIEYTEEKIRLNSSCGVIKISGKKLEVKQITDENLKIAGIITGVEFLN